VSEYLFSAVAQTFLSAGSGDFQSSVLTSETIAELESSANPQAGKPALPAADALNRNVSEGPAAAGPNGRTRASHPNAPLGAPLLRLGLRPQSRSGRWN